MLDRTNDLRQPSHLMLPECLALRGRGEAGRTPRQLRLHRKPVGWGVRVRQMSQAVFRRPRAIAYGVEIHQFGLEIKQLAGLPFVA